MNSTDNANNRRPWIITASILIIVNCLALIPSMAYTPLTSAIKKAITMSYTQVGLFAGMAGVLAIICAVPAGMAIKKFGARKVFLSGVVFMIAGLLMLSFSTNFAGALSGRGIWQIGLRFLLPALTAATVVVIPDKHRSKMLGIGIAVSYIGTITAMNIGAYISQTSGWQSAIRLFAAIVALAAVIFFFFYRGNAAAEGETLKTKKEAVNPNEPKVRSVYAMPSVWLLCLLVIFSSEEGVIDNFAQLQMVDVWKTSQVQFAHILSIGMVIAIFANLVAGWCGDKFGRWNMLVVSGIINSFVGIFLLMGQGGNMNIYIVGILIAKTLQLTSTLYVNSMAPTFLKGRDIGPIIAIIFLGNGLGQYLGPQVIGILKDKTGAYTWGWIYIMACGILATLVAMGFRLYFGGKNNQKNDLP